MRVNSISISILIALFLIVNSFTYGQMKNEDGVKDSFLEQILSEEDAIQQAHNLVKNYAQFSRLLSDSEEDWTDEFLSLFSLNASLPLDYLLNADFNLVSPSKYTSDYLALEIDKPLESQTFLLESKTTVRAMGDGLGFRVTVYVERKMNRVYNGTRFVTPEKKRSYIQNIEILVKEGVAPQIDRVFEISPSYSNHLTLDLFGLSQISGTKLEAGNTLKLAGLDGAEYSLNSIGANVRYHFNPFSPISSLGSSRLGLFVGLGMENWNYKIDAVTITGETTDYLGESDAVVLLQNGSNLNNQANAQDFVQLTTGYFLEETISRTSLSGAAGFSYALSEGNGAKTILELGLGFVASSTVNSEVNSSSDNYALFAEGPFNVNEVQFYSDRIIYNGQMYSGIIPSVYNLDDPTESRSYTTEMDMSSFFEIKLIQMFNLDNKLGLGGFVTFRQHLNSPFESNSYEPASLKEVIDDGAPRVSTFSNGQAPVFLGLGIRLQKN